MSRSDLGQLDVLHDILAVLNEPAADAKALGKLVERMPVLAARLQARFRSRSSREANAESQIALLGNRAFESVLLELLEDLTVLRAELDE